MKNERLLLRLFLILVFSIALPKALGSGSGTLSDPYTINHTYDDCGGCQMICDGPNAQHVQQEYDSSLTAEGDWWFQFLPPGNQKHQFKKTCNLGEDGCGFIRFEIKIGSGCGSPLICDLSGNGIHLGPSGIGVYFDIDADGSQDHIQWVDVGGDEAFLALDRNGNGIVDNGSELFGNATPLELQPGVQSLDGFKGLAQYDLTELGGNLDGAITSADDVWSDLSFWLDTNADGLSTPGEMLTMENAGMKSLPIDKKVNNRQDSAGNWLPYWEWATRVDHPKKVKLVDVFFVELE